MASWKSKAVGDGVDALPASQRLHESFFQFAKLGNLPAGIAVFARYDLRENVVTWWFSPEAEMLALAYGATDCEKPEPEEGFSLLVGDARGWDIHFPGYVPSRRRRD